MSTSSQTSSAASSAASARIGGVPTRNRSIPPRAVAGSKAKGARMAHPARRRLAQPRHGAGATDEGRCAGAAVEVFVGAADGEIGVGSMQVDGSAPAEWARSQTTSAPAAWARAVSAAMSCARRSCSQPRSASPRRRCRRWRLRRLAGAATRARAPGGAAQPSRHVEVGREVAAVRQDHRRPGRSASAAASAW